MSITTQKIEIASLCNHRFPLWAGVRERARGLPGVDRACWTHGQRHCFRALDSEALPTSPVFKRTRAQPIPANQTPVRAAMVWLDCSRVI
eukprot:3932964-Rhodomonas_salina.2